MYRLTKVFLTALPVLFLASYSFGADTLADAFKNGKFKGELKAYYFDKDVENAPTKSDHILDTAAVLNFVTDKFYGFSLGQTFVAIGSPAASTQAKTVFKSDMYGPGAVLSEAYLGYDIANTGIKLGRQYISTPLIAGSGSRIMKESFQGVTIVNKDLPDTTLTAGYVDKFQGRTSTVMGDADDDAPDFDNKLIFYGVSGSKAYEFSDAYTIALTNKSVPNLTLTGQYAVVNDTLIHGAESDVDIYYLEGEYDFLYGDFNIKFAGNYRGSQDDSDINPYDGNYTAGKISIKSKSGYGLSFAAATTSDDNVISGLGNGAGTYTGTLIRASSATLTAGTDTYKLDLNYDLSKVGLAGVKGVLQYGWSKQDRVRNAATNSDYTSYAAGLYYAIPILDGLSLSVEYETQEVEKTTYSTGAKTSVDTDELWCKAIYKF